MTGATFNWGATDVIDGYTCSTWDASGPEYAWTFVADEDATVTIDLGHGSGYDLDLYVLRPDCAADFCIAYGDGSAMFDAEQDKLYYVVIDGRDGDAGLYSLATSCVP